MIENAELGLPRYVEVETSRRCNRSCAWCPNGEHTARRVQELMDWSLFCRIADELGEFQYDGWFAFHNYNEPLLNERITDEIAYVCRVMPQARPAIYSNGDVLNHVLFERLVAAGMVYLRVTRYPRHADTPPSYEAVKGWLDRAGLLDMFAWRFEPVRQGLAAIVDTGRLRVEVISPAILSTYNNRGGSVTVLPVLARPRTEPCWMTTTSAVIDYRGRMKMCCCVYPDTADHAGYVIGDLHTTSFTELWAGERMRSLRAAHQAADWSLSPACATCVQPLPETRR